MGGALWFIIVLFFLTLFYAFIDLVIKTLLRRSKCRNIQKKILLIQGVVSIVLLLIGYKFSWYVGVDNYTQLKVASFYILYYFGVLFKIFQSKTDSINHIIKILIWLLSFSLLVFMTMNKNIQSFELAGNSYGNPLLLLTASLFGFAMLYLFSIVVSKLITVSDALVFIGRSTLSILILHFLCFKIVSFIGVVIYGKPLFLIASFPVYFEGGLWWLAYTIAGVSVPILIGWIYSVLKNKAKALIHKKRRN